MLFLSQWGYPGNDKCLTLHPKTSLEIRTKIINLLLEGKDRKRCFSGLVQSISLQKRYGVVLIRGPVITKEVNNLSSFPYMPLRSVVDYALGGKGGI